MKFAPFAFVILWLLASCNKLSDHYAGFVVDESGNPIVGVLVREDLAIAMSDTTNNDGYFKIKRSKNLLSDLIFSKKGYKTDTIEITWSMHGERVMYSDILTKSNSEVIMYKSYKDSIINSSDKLRHFPQDSIEMFRDDRLLSTQYLNPKKGDAVYRYYDFDGTIQREVYNIDAESGQLHFVEYKPHVASKAYLSSVDSLPPLLKNNLGKYWRIGVINTVDEEKTSKRYILWYLIENWIVGQNEEYIGIVNQYKDKRSELTKYQEDKTVYWDYYSNGQLSSHWENEYLYGAAFSNFHITYDSMGHKVQEINWKHSYPEWGESYNNTFSVATTRKYYPNGKLKSITKDKSFCEGDSYRCGTWIYYNEKGKVIKTEKYGDETFNLDEKYNETNFIDEN